MYEIANNLLNCVGTILDDNPLKQISYQHHSLLENLQYFLLPYLHWEHKDFHFYE